MITSAYQTLQRRDVPFGFFSSDTPRGEGLSFPFSFSSLLCGSRGSLQKLPLWWKKAVTWFFSCWSHLSGLHPSLPLPLPSATALATLLCSTTTMYTSKLHWRAIPNAATVLLSSIFLAEKQYYSSSTKVAKKQLFFRSSTTPFFSFLDVPLT